MAHLLHDFSYDGTLEGLLCVFLRCISSKVMPLDIRPDFMLEGRDFRDRYIFVRSNPGDADRFYRYLGSCAGAGVQQMIIDCFLTSLPRMELDLYDLVCRAIRFGGSVEEDYGDETMKRIHFAIRDLYRESHSMIRALEFRPEMGVHVTQINPRNCVLPLIRNSILGNPEYDDLMAYDRRHRLLLLRTGADDDILDIRHLPVPRDINSADLYETFWPYAFKVRFPPGDAIRRRAESLDPLWRIA